MSQNKMPDMLAEDKKNLENLINNNLSDTVGLRLQITVQVQRAYPVMNVSQSSLLQKIKILKF